MTKIWDHICKRFAQVTVVLVLATVLGCLCHLLYTVGPKVAIVGALTGLAIYMFSNGVATWMMEGTNEETT